MHFKTAEQLLYEQAIAERDAAVKRAEALECGLAYLSMRYDACAENCVNWIDGCRGDDDLCKGWQFDEARFAEKEVDA